MDKSPAFWMAQIPEHMMAEQDVSPGAKLVWMYLYTWRGKGKPAFPGQKKIADSVGMSQRHVKRLVKELEDCAWITTTVHPHTQTYRYECYFADAGRGQDVPGGGDNMSPGVGTICPPTSSQIPSTSVPSPASPNGSDLDLTSTKPSKQSFYRAARQAWKMRFPDVTIPRKSWGLTALYDQIDDLQALYKILDTARTMADAAGTYTKGHLHKVENQTPEAVSKNLSLILNYGKSAKARPTVDRDKGNPDFGYAMNPDGTGYHPQGGGG